LTAEQAEQKLREMREREATLRAELSRLDALLADVPDENTIRLYVEKIEGLIFVHDGDWSNQYAGGNTISSFLCMTPEDKKNLIKAVFDTPLVDGTPAGVYVYLDDTSPPHGRRKFNFRIRGRLEFERVMSRARHCTERGPPGRRSCGPPPRSAA
jgi:hypothetical protein